jgi:hypothetical protein
MLKSVVRSLLCGIAVATLATAANAADVKGGVEGKIVKVDAAKGAVTISSDAGEKTYTVTQATTIVGPRGGIVHRRLKDPRFHAGLPVTVVASGTNATQLLLGIDRKAGGKGDAGKSGERSSGFRGDDSAKSDEAADEDNDFPGKIKSVDADKHMLVVTLLNGKDRSFMVGSDAKVTVGRRSSTKGLSDPAFKAGASLTVSTEEGGHKVKEVKLSAGGAMRGGPRRFGAGVRRPPQE